MTTNPSETNLLIGVLALQAGILTEAQFIEACTVCSLASDSSCAAFLLARGWINDVDLGHLKYLVTCRDSNSDCSDQSYLAALPNSLKRTLVCPKNLELQESISRAPMSTKPDTSPTVTQMPDPHQRYELKRLHAEGGIGRVWIAHDAKLHRRVALKELRPDQNTSDESRIRFFSEATITGQLAHPGIVPIYDLSTWDGSDAPFYTMPFIEGCTLSQAANQYHRTRTAGDADFQNFLDLLSAFVSVCETVEYAHSCGVIHRDLKGANIAIGSFGETIILDWGLSRFVDQPQADNAEKCFQEYQYTSPDLTIEGQAVGTPAYMAPEQAGGKLDQIGPLTDVYGLGTMLYEILTGHAPFSGPDLKSVLDAVCNDVPKHPREYWAEVPANLETICLRAIEKKPQERYSSAHALGRDVKGWQESQRKQMEEAWRESEAFYHALVDSVPQGILRKDVDGRFTYASQGACKLLALEVDQVLGKTDFDLCPFELATKYRQDDELVIASRQPMEITEEHKTIDGPERFVRTVKTPVYNEHGSPLGIQVVFWDVSEHRKLEEQFQHAQQQVAKLQEELSIARSKRE